MIKNIFSKSEIPEKVPEGMEMIISELKRSDSKKDCLKRAYKILTSKYQGHRVFTYFRFYDAFSSDVNKLWAKNGFLHCHKLNYLLRILLIKSGFFSEDDIELRWTLTWYISPHQYCRVKVDSAWINIDLWAKAYGTKFGDYAYGFN